MASQMWARPPKIPCIVLEREDLNVFFTARMNSIGDDAWQKTLERPFGYSPFTGERTWADGSDHVSEHC